MTLPKPIRWTLAGLTLLTLLFVYAPLGLVLLNSFNTSQTFAWPPTGFTTEWWGRAWSSPGARDAIWVSVQVAVIATVIALVLGTMAALALTRYRFFGRDAVSLLIILLQLGLSLSLFTVVLGHVLICVPYSVAVLTSGFEGFDRSLEEASADLGETAFGTFRRVTLPMVAPAIISSLLVSFTISLDEFIMAFFLTGTEVTLPVYIWGQLRFAAKLPGVLALGTILLVGSFVLLTIAETLRRRAERRVRDSRGAHA